MEGLVEARLLKLCVIPGARSFLGLCVLFEDISRRFPLEEAGTRVDRVMLINQRNGN